MRVVARLLQLCRPLTPGFSIVVCNPPWHDLVIRDTHQKGPHGLVTVSVAHSTERDGKILRVPEMLFEVEGSRKTFILTPFCLRNEPAGVEQYSVTRDNGPISVNFRLQQEHMAFARHWNACLEEQGYLPAFQRTAFVAELWETFENSLAAQPQRGTEDLKLLFDAAVTTTLAKGVPAL